MIIVRRIGALALAIAAVIVWFAAAPDAVDASEFKDDISSALSADAANNLLTEGAPQQTVVNGWTAKDLLTIQAEQTNELLQTSEDPRPGLLVLLGVFGIALMAFTSERRLTPMPQFMAAPPPSMGPPPNGAPFAA